jgi:hypothetical protein
MRFLNFKRRAVDPAAKAAEIKAKHAAKEAERAKPALFTKAQEELMDELGLTPGGSRDLNETNDQRDKREKKTKARDPLTARQRKLAEELGLIKPD